MLQGKQLGIEPTRADRFSYVMYKDKPINSINKTTQQRKKLEATTGDSAIDAAFELLTHPITGSKAHGKGVVGILLLHVDDSFFTGTHEFMTYLVNEMGKEYKTGSEGWSDIMFCGQRITCTLNDQNYTQYIRVDQEGGIVDLAEIDYDKNLSLTKT